MKITKLGKVLALAALLTLSLSANAFAEIELSGYVGNDFPPEFCFDDNDGDADVGIPESYPIAISGFDISNICLQYDPDTDVLYVGAGTQLDGETGEATVFGDADNDFDPGKVSPATAAAVPKFIDSPNLGLAEYFALIIDFDNDIATKPNFVAGVTFTKDIDGFVVAEIAEPLQPLALSFIDAFYGDPIGTSADSAIAFNPDGENPSLEFTVTNLSAIAGFENLEFDNPDYKIGLFFKTGSLADGGIGEDSFGSANDLNPIDLAAITYSEGQQNTPADDNSADNADDDGADDDESGEAGNSGDESDEDASADSSSDGSDSPGGGCSLASSAVPTPSTAASAIALFLLAPIFMRRMFFRQLDSH